MFLGGGLLSDVGRRRGGEGGRREEGQGARGMGEWGNGNGELERDFIEFCIWNDRNYVLYKHDLNGKKRGTEEREGEGGGGR